MRWRSSHDRSARSTAGPALSVAELARRGGPAPPPVIRARLGAMLSIERAGMPPAVLAALKHLGSVANPEFHEKQRMRFSTWNTPRFISCYRKTSIGSTFPADSPSESPI